MKPFSINDLVHFKGVGAANLAPDASGFVYVQTEIMEKENGYRSTLWLYQDQKNFQLTNGQKPLTRDQNPKWSPDGKQIAFTSNRSGSNQIWLIAAQGGEARQLTDLAKGVQAYSWSPDGKKIYFNAKEETPSEDKPREGAQFTHVTLLKYKMNGVGFYDRFYSQIYEIDVSTLEVKKLTEGDFNCAAPMPSPDGKWLAFMSNRTGLEQNTINDLWLLSLDKGELKNLTEQKVALYGASWHKDSQGLVYAGHHKGPIPGSQSELWQVNLKAEHKNLMPDFPLMIGSAAGSDIRMDTGSSAPQVADCGKYVFFTATDGGNSYLYSLTLADGEIRVIHGEGDMVVFSYSEVQGVVVLSKTTPTTPAEFYLADLKTDSLFTQVTNVNEALLADRFVSKAEVVHFTHEDGTVLEGWLLKPYNYEEGKKYPLVMEIHGGPHTAYGNSFFHEFQVLTGLGYGVYYGNPRGSVGYGEEFAQAIIGDWCGVDADDLLFMAQEVSKLPWVDETRMGVTGGSQGGYFTNWLIGHTDMFKAAVTQRSMSNILSKYGTADNGWAHDRRGMGGADIWDREDFLMERSPIRYAPQVKTPLLFIHSDQDHRCPLEQAEQFYVALKRLGVETEMVIFKGENHELSRSGKPANRLTRLDYMMNWFKKYLDQEEELF